MTTAMSNPKTTALGVLMILGALVNALIAYYQGHTPDLTLTMSTISGGIGLILAKDGTTHSTAAEVEQATTKASAK
jgi:hypothetical protein